MKRTCQIKLLCQIPTENGKQESTHLFQLPKQQSDELKKLLIDYKQMEIIQISIQVENQEENSILPDQASDELLLQNMKQFFQLLIFTKLEHLKTIEYENHDQLFNSKKLVISLLKETKSIKNLSLATESTFEAFQYATFFKNYFANKLIEKLMISTNELKDVTIAEKKGSSFLNLWCFVGGSLIQDNPLCKIIARSLSLQRLDFNLLEPLHEQDIDKFLGMLPKYKQELQEVELKVNQVLVNVKMCFQHLQKIELIQVLHLKIQNNSLSKSDLNLLTLPHLRELTLTCQEPLEYLFSFEKLTISDVSLFNSGRTKNKCISKHVANWEINKFSYQFCSETDMSNILHDLQLIILITSQLNELKLDFSQYFQGLGKEFNNQVILKLGKLFQQCSEDMKLDLVTINGYFSSKSRFMLGWEFRHLKNLQKFYMNDLNIYNEVIRYQYQHDISFAASLEKTPYLLMGLYAANIFHNKIITIDYPDFFSISSLKDINNNTFFKELFQSFVRISLNHLQKFNVEILPQFLKSVFSDSIIYIDLKDYQVPLRVINRIVNASHSLQTLCTMIKDEKDFFYGEVVAKRGIQIHLDIISYRIDQTSFNQMMNIKKHFLYFKRLEKIYFIKQSNIYDITNQLIGQCRTHLSIEGENMNQVYNAPFWKTASEMKNNIYSEKVKIIIFQSLIESFIPINPALVYMDLLIA